jgi:hypothetical protein
MSEWLFDPTTYRVAPDDVIDIIVNGESVARFAIRVRTMMVTGGHADHHVSFERVDILPAMTLADEADTSPK